MRSRVWLTLVRYIGWREAEKVLAGGGREGLRGLGYGMFYEGRWMLELGGWDGWKSLGFGYY